MCLLEFLTGSLENNLSFGNDIDPSRQTQGHSHVLLHQKHRDALLVDILMTCSTVSTISGARPSVGSSIKMTSGFPMRVRAMVSICCSPPDKWPPLCLSLACKAGKYL